MRGATSVVFILLGLLVAAGCSTPLVSDGDRISRCVQLQREKLGGKYTNEQYQQACTAWNNRGLLGDDGTYRPPEQ